MDTKRLVAGVVLSMGIFFGWLMLVQYLDRTHPAPPPSQSALCVERVARR